MKPPTLVSSTNEPSAAPSSRARKSTFNVVLSPADSVCATARERREEVGGGNNVR
jgi:hypothetical protein